MISVVVPQRGSAVLNPVEMLLAFPKVSDTQGSPNQAFFSGLPSERPQEGTTQSH